VTVTGEFRIDIRPYSAYDDPSFPVAAWIAQAGIAGDASGGLLIIDFLFQGPGAQISELFNLEQLAIDTNANTVEDIMIETIGMDTLAPNRLASPQKWSVTTDNVLGTDSAVRLNAAAQGLPLWLGAPSRQEGNGVIRFTFLNANLRLYAITIQGMMWGPRSVLAPGGPRRPLSGLFT